MKQGPSKRLQLINDIVKTLTANGGSSGVSAVLRLLIEYYTASRAFFFVYNDDLDELRCAFEECAGGVTAPPSKPMANEHARFAECFSDADSLLLSIDSAPVDAQVFLSALDLNALAAAPLFRDGQLAGFTGLCDPQTGPEDIDLLSTVGYLLAGELDRYADLAVQVALATRYNAIVEALPSGVCVFDFAPDRKLSVYVNDAYAQILNEPREEVAAKLTRDPLHYIHEDDRRRVHRELRAYRRGHRQAKSLSFRIKRADGSVRSISENISFISGDDHVTLFSVCTDITDRELHAEQLRLENKRMEQSGELYRIALASSSLAIWDYEHRSKRLIPAADDKQRVIENVPESLVENGHVHPDYVEAYLDMYRRLSAGEKYIEGIFRVHSEEHPAYWYELIRYTNVFDADGEPYMAVGMSEDVTEKYAAQQAFARELQTQQTLPADMYATLLLDVTNWSVLRYQCRDEQFSAALEGRSAADVFRCTAESVADDPSVRSLFENMTRDSLLERYATQNETLTLEYQRRMPGGETRWVREVLRLLSEPGTRRLMLFMQLWDVDAEKRLIDELALAAETDSMTGFLDHDGAMRHMRSYLAGEGRRGRHALFMIDIDNFKTVNDRLGHMKGDEVITRIAASIRSQFRDTDILGRIGGDEFLVLMKNVASPSLIVKKASDLVDALQFVCAGESGSVSLSASVGVSLYTAADESLETLYADADATLYRAKDAGKNRYAISAGSEKDAVIQESAEPSGIVQLRTLLEHMDGGVLLAEAGEEIVIRYVSPSFFKTMHRSPQEAGDHGEKLLDFVLEEDRAALIAALHSVAESGQLLDIAFRVGLPDVLLGWRRLRVALLPGSAGSLPQLIGVLSDITEMKRSAAQLEAIIENAPCGIGMLEYDGAHLKPLLFNDTIYQMANADSKEAFAEYLGDDILAKLQEDERARYIAALDESLEKGAAFEIVYQSPVLHDGGPGAVQVRGTRLREFEQEGRPVMLMMYTDVTRQAEMEDELRLAEERYRVAITCAGIILWEVDIPARVMRQSPEAAQRFSHENIEIHNLPEGLIEQGNLARDSIAEVRRMFADMFAGKDDEEYFTRSRIDGRFMWLKMRFKVLKNEEGEPYYAVGISEPVPNIDVEMRRFEQEQRLSSLLEDNLMSAFHINISKDRVEYFYVNDGPFENASPQTFEDLREMGMQLAADDEDREEFLAHLSPDHLFTMFRANQTFLFIGFKRKGERGTRYTDVSIHLLRHPVSGDLYGFFYLSDADTRRRWEANLPRPPEFDSVTKMYSAGTAEALGRSVLANSRHLPGLCALTVLSLAGLDQLRATRSAIVINELLITVGRLCRVIIAGDVFTGVLDGSHVVMFRTDAGSTNAHQDRIRRLRERIDQALQLTHPDDPIELVFGFATERLQEANYDTLLRKARLACRSALSRADSSIALYAEPSNDMPEAAPLIEPAQQRGTVLIVDDSPSYLEMLQVLFEADYTVLTAVNGMDALTCMRQHPEISAVILDLFMPELDGFQVLEAMRGSERLAKIPVIVVTSDDDARSESRVLDLGAADAISKPFFGQTMLLRVRNIIARSDAARIAEQNRAYELRFQQQANMLRLADYDELTGVYNKRAFYAHVRKMLDMNPGQRYVIIRWDIDRFKVFNDVFGTHAGDTLLREIGALMHEYAGGSIYGHIEADHFALCMPEAEADVNGLVDRVTHFLDGYPVAFRFAPRFGVYLIDEPQTDVNLMCDRALLALRSIKGSFTNKVAYYDGSLRNRLLDEQELLNGMQTALEREEFVLHFQPQYNYSSGELVGAEALVRWQHPTRGLLMPGEFIPLFENNGFVSLLDRYVWERSCRIMRRWLDDADRLVPVSIAVNISRLDIYDPMLCDSLKALVEKYRLPPSFLKLEITESAYMENPEQLIEVVNTLQQMGFTVEMDDFGSGYSSLNTLKDVPVDVLKLDIKFLSGSGDASRGGNILSSVIRMARWLQLPVIAEGVETREQADYLKSLGCPYMQGYFFSKPLSAQDFEALLVKSDLGRTDDYRHDSVEGAAAFWDASVQTGLIFNYLAGAAAIMEYRDGQLEALRINDDVFRVLGTTREAYARLQTHMLDRFSDGTRPLFIDMLERAIATGEEAACETVSKPLDKGQKPFWTRSRARLLAQSGDSYLFYITLENVTERKELEQQLQIRSYSEMLLGVYDEVFELDYTRELFTVRVSKRSETIQAGSERPLRESLNDWCANHVDAEDAPALLELVAPESRHAGTVVYACTQPNGERRQIAATMMRVSDDLYLLCNLDISNRRQANLS